jgi:hypothetical protein
VLPGDARYDCRRGRAAPSTGHLPGHPAQHPPPARTYAPDLQSDPDRPCGAIRAAGDTSTTTAGGVDPPGGRRLRPWPTRRAGTACLRLSVARAPAIALRRRPAPWHPARARPTDRRAVGFRATCAEGQPADRAGERPGAARGRRSAGLSPLSSLSTELPSLAAGGRVTGLSLARRRGAQAGTGSVGGTTGGTCGGLTTCGRNGAVPTAAWTYRAVRALPRAPDRGKAPISPTGPSGSTPWPPRKCAGHRRARVRATDACRIGARIGHGRSRTTFAHVSSRADARASGRAILNTARREARHLDFRERGGGGLGVSESAGEPAANGGRPRRRWSPPTTGSSSPPSVPDRRPPRTPEARSARPDPGVGPAATSGRGRHHVEEGFGVRRTSRRQPSPAS